MGTLTRIAYVVAYLAAAVVFGLITLMIWWLFAAIALGEFGCDGLDGPCGSAGRFTSDYWWVISLIAAVLIGLALFPVYRRLIRFYSE